jgi:hypothetical protein
MPTLQTLSLTPASPVCVVPHTVTRCRANVLRLGLATALPQVQALASLLHWVSHPVPGLLALLQKALAASSTHVFQQSRGAHETPA